MTMSKRANRACLRCQKQKRRCDKLLPACSLCTRLDRNCCYTELHQPHTTVTAKSHQQTLFLPPPVTNSIYPSLQTPNHDLDLRALVYTVIGDENEIRQAAAAYFRTIHTWLPVIAEGTYFQRIPSFQSQPTADFSLLTLCIFLLGAVPRNGEMPIGMRSLYAQTKSSVASLEAMEFYSLDLLQCRLLLTIFEVGHGMYPAAYISMGGNVRAAIALGVNAPSKQRSRIFRSMERAEEARLTWRGIVITDRYVSLGSDNGPSLIKEHAPEVSKSDEDDEFYHSPTVRVISSGHEDQFTKLAHASRLLDQGLAHVLNPTSHEDFNFAEATQLLKTLNSFRETLLEEGNTRLVPWCSAFAVCRSALIIVLASGCHNEGPYRDFCIAYARNKVESTIGELVQLSDDFTVTEAPIGDDLEGLPVFVLHSIYKAAFVLMHELRYAPKLDVGRASESLKGLLAYMGRRWLAGRRYLEELERESMRMDMSSESD